MPAQRCSKDGKKGWRWDKHGVCFIGNNSKEKAEAVGKAIKASKNKEKRNDTNE